MPLEFLYSRCPKSRYLSCPIVSHIVSSIDCPLLRRRYGVVGDSTVEVVNEGMGGVLEKETGFSDGRLPDEEEFEGKVAVLKVRSRSRRRHFRINVKIRSECQNATVCAVLLDA